MATIPALQLAPAATSSSTAQTKPEGDDAARFGDVFSREISRPSTPANGDSAKPSDKDVSKADDAVVAEVPLDPLLLSLQVALAQTNPQILPQTSVKTPAGGDLPVLAGRKADAASAAIGALGGAPDSEKSAGLPVQMAQLASQEAGKPLPEDVATAANPASFSALLQAQGEGDDVLPQEDKPLSAPVAAQPAVSHRPVTEVAPARTVTTHLVAEPVSDSRWGEVVAQRVSMMLGRQEQQLQMQLNPPHLGPMEVQLTMGKEQATIVFTSQQASVREALAAATPRLTALLADQGITLSNVQVASDSLNQHNQQQAAQQQASGGQRQRGGRESDFLGVATGELARVNLGEIRVPVARSGVSLYV